MVFGETTQTDHSDEEAVNEVECVYVMYMRPKTALLYTDSITVHCNCQKIRICCNAAAFIDQSMGAVMKNLVQWTPGPTFACKIGPPL